VLAVGCAGPIDATPDASSDPGPEITGEQVDPDQGWCVGVVGNNPQWARCNTQRCELDEQSCLVTPACRAVYADDLRTTGAERIFRACYPTATVAAAHSGSCVGLDAMACSGRDDCAAIHEGLFIYTPFLRCESETCVSGARMSVGCGAQLELRQ
jgi:hypothetical protein